MMIQPCGQEPVTVYHASPYAVQTVLGLREHLHQIARHCLNRPVRVQSIYGHIHEGTIVGVDSGHIYLQTAAAGDNRQLLAPSYYSSTILPLVLYELLVITLLYT